MAIQHRFSCIFPIFIAFLSTFSHGQAIEYIGNQDGDDEVEKVMTEMLSIARQPFLQKELELTEDQVAELRELSESYAKEVLSLRSSYNESIAEAKKLFDLGNHEEAQKKLFSAKDPAKKVSKEYLAKFEQIVLPHQQKRARQISTVESFRKSNTAANGSSNEFGIYLLAAHKLKVSEDEMEALRKEVVKENAEFQKQVDLLRKKAKSRIDSVVPTAQKEKFEELVGDFFYLNQNKDSHQKRENKKND